MKLIDKDAFTDRVQTQLSRLEGSKDNFDKGAYAAYNDILRHIDTFEVKEVDLDKELDTWRHNHFHGRRDKDASGEYLERSSQLDIAKYFFEIGLKAQKS